jgi:hypothetical protein
MGTVASFLNHFSPFYAQKIPEHLCEKHMQILIGVISVLATILASLQTFFNYSDLSEKHNLVAIKYGSLRREIDEYLISHKSNDALKSLFQSIRPRWDQIDQEAPALPDRIFRRGNEIITSRPLKI